MQIEHLPDGSFKITEQLPEWLIKAIEEADEELRERIQENVMKVINDAYVECFKGENVARLIDDSILYGID